MTPLAFACVTCAALLHAHVRQWCVPRLGLSIIHPLTVTLWFPE
jgi:hypothetical protein